MVINRKHKLWTQCQSIENTSFGYLEMKAVGQSAKLHWEGSLPILKDYRYINHSLPCPGVEMPFVLNYKYAEEEIWCFKASFGLLHSFPAVLCARSLNFPFSVQS